jgi:histidinol phosphatase-like PHP family hydrolase
VLERARAAGLSITLASDAHGPGRVGDGLDEIAAWAARAGYQEYVFFERRRPVTLTLPVAPAP